MARPPCILSKLWGPCGPWSGKARRTAHLWRKANGDGDDSERAADPRVPGHGPARPGRDEPGVPRSPRRTPVRDQDDAAGPEAERRRRRAPLPPRGGGHRPPGSPRPGQGGRGRRDAGPALPGDGAGGGREPGVAAQARRALGAGAAGGGPLGGQRHLRGAPARPHPPRPQAGQHHPAPQRAGEGDRLRLRRLGGGGRQPRRGRRGGGHLPVRRAGADRHAEAEGGQPRRHLLARRDPLRERHRHAPLQGEEPGGAAAHARRHQAAQRARREPHGAAGAGADHQQAPRQGPRRPVPDLPRPAGGHGQPGGAGGGPEVRPPGVAGRAGRGPVRRVRDPPGGPRHRDVLAGQVLGAGPVRPGHHGADRGRGAAAARPAWSAS